jgi:Zn-dependent M28 family amino/carboxypeptidase
VEAQRFEASAANLIADVMGGLAGPPKPPAPGRGPKEPGRASAVAAAAAQESAGGEVVVVCAHYDGHDLAESALDNATGSAAVIQIVETLAPLAARFRRSLRAILFTTEEWRLHGSAVYVDALGEAALGGIGLVVNLDTLAGSARLSALTSGFPGVADLVTRVAAGLGTEIAVVPRLLPNSDHFNFARRGVPALRLVAGFGDPESRVRYLLTQGDTCDKVAPAELKSAALVAAEIVWTALTQDAALPPHTTAAEMERLL